MYEEESVIPPSMAALYHIVARMAVLIASNPVSGRWIFVNFCSGKYGPSFVDRCIMSAQRPKGAATPWARMLFQYKLRARRLPDIRNAVNRARPGLRRAGGVGGLALALALPVKLRLIVSRM